MGHAINSAYVNQKAVLLIRMRTSHKSSSKMKPESARSTPVSTLETKPTESLKDHSNNLMPPSSPPSQATLVGYGDFMVSMGLGSPKKELALLFGTGSDITWTQCQPCVRSCYPQKDPSSTPLSLYLLLQHFLQHCRVFSARSLRCC